MSSKLVELSPPPWSMVVKESRRESWNPKKKERFGMMYSTSFISLVRRGAGGLAF
jgi:hypothetical protein